MPLIQARDVPEDIRDELAGYVLDASVAVTALTEPGSAAAGLLAGTDAVFQAPSIFDVEVTSALHALIRGGKYDPAAADGLIADLIILPVERWHTPSLLPRIWELRENLTPYDAAYVALAEMTGATLLTGDERIATAPATRCEIRIIK
jgi:predicted nucleic acid-binding protein